MLLFGMMIVLAIMLHGYNQLHALHTMDESSNNDSNELFMSRQRYYNSPNFNFTKLVDVTCNNPSVNMLTVATPEQQTSKVTGKIPRVLCIVLTHSENHYTHIPTIQSTWGKKCDKLIISSDVDDPNLGSDVIRIKSQVGYWGIWDKLQQTLLYVHEKYRLTDQFDWILKADDDTFVIMENLKAFIANEIDTRQQPSQATGTSSSSSKNFDQFRSRLIQNPLKINFLRTNLTNYTAVTSDDKQTKQNRQYYGNLNIYNEPIVFARTMPFPRFRELYWWPNWLNDKLNFWFGRRFNKTGIDTANGVVVYPHGGPGYFMNWMYIDVLVDAFLGDPKNRIRGRVSEDIANAMTMLYRGITPHSTRDPSTNLERSHPEIPEIMYDNPRSLMQAQVNIENTGYGLKCCSPSSISYHHVRPEHMKLINFQIYECPSLFGKQ